MYADPRHIRNNRINLSLTDAERRAIEAIAELNGTQPAVLVGDLMIEFLRSSVSDSSHTDPQMRATH